MQICNNVDKTSTRRLCWGLANPHCTVWRTIRNQLNSHAHYIQTMDKMKAEVYLARQSMSYDLVEGAENKNLMATIKSAPASVYM